MPTVYSGIQQTGAGSQGADRAGSGWNAGALHQPHRATPRTFSIPIDVPGGSGPNSGVFGTLGRNTFRGPGLRDFDIALIKDTPLLERAGSARASLQFHAELFNVFNIVNFGLPSNIVLGPGFGEISRTASNSRQIQFSLKAIY